MGRSRSFEKGKVSMRRQPGATSQAPATVFVVDDDDQLRESLQLLLTTVGLRVEAFASAEAFLDRYRGDRSGCLILDVQMPGMDGLALLERLAAQKSPLAVIMLTAYADVHTVVHALKASAFEFLEKPCPARRLIDCVHQALEHTARHWQQVQARSAVAARLAQLTAREHQVLSALMKCESNQNVGRALSISARTVEAHRIQILRKMEVRSLAELIGLVLQQGEREFLPPLK
jgi:FixJ family two-component response regulator